MKRGKTMGNKSTTSKASTETTRGTRRGSTRGGATRGRGQAGTTSSAELAHPAPASKSSAPTTSSRILATFEAYSSNS